MLNGDLLLHARQRWHYLLTNNPKNRSSTRIRSELMKHSKVSSNLSSRNSALLVLRRLVPISVQYFCLLPLIFVSRASRLLFCQMNSPSMLLITEWMTDCLGSNVSKSISFTNTICVQRINAINSKIRGWSDYRNNLLLVNDVKLQTLAQSNPFSTQRVCSGACLVGCSLIRQEKNTRHDPAF